MGLFDNFGQKSKKQHKKGWSSSNTQKYGYKGSTVRDAGFGSSQNEYKNASHDDVMTFDQIKAECIENGSLWEDPDFPAEDSSLYFKNRPSVRGDIEWKRPSEFCDAPCMFDAEGASRLDVNQGVLGDCWLLAAVSCLATNERLLYRVVSKDNSFGEGKYAGVFRFHIWQYGRWIEVLVDDRLPVTNDRLIYMHSDNKNEFWTALLEKAYAKLHGSYEALSGGLTSEALTDFTGGVVERFELRDKCQDDMLNRMLRAHKRLSLMGCSIDATPDQMEARLDNGLIIGHAYSITDVRLVDIKTSRVSGRIPMVRVRNPWGDEHEWTGAWSDNSEEWTQISEDERNEMGLVYSNDGEFWMSFENFKTEFQRVEICYLGPDTLVEDDDCSAKWEGQLMEGNWKRRVNAGGCANYKPTFHTNPQYRITVSEPDDDDEDGKSTIIVGLMQKERRKLKTEGKSDLTIGYAIYQLEDPEFKGTLDRSYFGTNRTCGRSPAFINLREISGHHALEAGTYVIVPSTFEPDHEGDFILRVFSEKENATNELDDETGLGEPNADKIGEETEEDQGRREEGYDSFLKLAGEDGELDAFEIQEILNHVFVKDEEFAFDGFSADMCRGMVAMYDADISGKLTFSDFKRLWSDLTLCKNAFRMVDTDGNNYFSSYEYRRALQALGFRLSNSTFNAIVMRYSDKDGHVVFDDFVASYIKLKTMFGLFQSKDNEEGNATFRMDEFVQLTMYS